MAGRWRFWVTFWMIVLAIGFAIPENAINPVQGADRDSWNPKTFWSEPWGASGVHHGIDVFAKKGTPVVSSVPGIVVLRGTIAQGGKIVVIFGPKWRLHYYAHLDSIDVRAPWPVGRGTQVGTVGDTGNAQGKPPHLHYSIISLVPYIWRYEKGAMGWRKMFFLDPGEVLP